MTVIACRVSQRSIEIASDTQTTWGGNKYPKQDTSDKQINATGKVFRVNGITIGAAGSIAHIGLLQIYCKTNLPKEMDRDSILHWLIDFKNWCNDKYKVSHNDLSIHGIIVKDGKAFSFFDFLEVNLIKNFTAVGSGMFLAIGAMELGASAKQAVKVAIKYDLYCGGKINNIKI